MDVLPQGASAPTLPAVDASLERRGSGGMGQSQVQQRLDSHRLQGVELIQPQQGMGMTHVGMESAQLQHGLGPIQGTGLSGVQHRVELEYAPASYQHPFIPQPPLSPVTVADHNVPLGELARTKRTNCNQGCI